MRSRERVAETGRRLAAIALGRSLLLGASVGLTLAAMTRPLGAGAASVFVGALSAIAAGWWIYRRVRGAGFTVPSVALWIEEHLPSSGWELVTAVEDGAPEALERSVAALDWSSATRQAARRALAMPAIALLAALGLLAASIVFTPAVSRLAGRITPGARTPAGTLDVTVEVIPPDYARLRGESLRNPAVVRALVGSRLRLSSHLRDSLRLMVGDRDVAAATPWPVGPQPVALRLRSGDASRLIAIDPIPDSAPAVQLRDPPRDTVLAIPGGVFALGADVRDDLGIARAAFEYIVSSGSGETFTFTTGSTGARQLGGAQTGTIAGSLSLATLNLKPGDFVHLRAVATDLRPDTATARGASETRTIRIARAGEFDSVAVEAAAPPEADRAVLSQRMLINLAESLVRRRRQLARTTFADESRSLARDQARLRKQVSDIVFARLGDDPSGEHFHGDGHQHEGQELRPALTPDELLKAAENATGAAAGKVLDFEGDETPVVAVNRPLLEAYNFMWDAGRELDQGEPGKALPAMYRALDAIQRARAAERLYLRGRPPRAVVDVDRVRLQGREKGTPAAREPREHSTDAATARVALTRFARVVMLARTAPAAAADSLLLLRMDLLPRLSRVHADAAARAAATLRAGRDAAADLAVLRRALEGVAARDSMSRWSGAR